MSNFPRENYVICKIVRQIKNGNEIGIVSDARGFHIGPLTQITDPDKITTELDPLFQQPHSLPSIDCAWRICAVSVVGGFYCDLNDKNEILNPTGIVSAPSPGYKYGTVDYAKHPNGLIYQLTLTNEESEKCQIAYFDRETNIRTNDLTHRHEIRFNRENTDVSKLNIFADPHTESTGYWMWRKFTNFARRPLGQLACYTFDDIDIN